MVGIGVLERRGSLILSIRTIYTYAIAQVCVGEDLVAVRDGQRCASSPAGRGVERVQGRDR